MLWLCFQNVSETLKCSIDMAPIKWTTLPIHFKSGQSDQAEFISWPIWPLQLCKWAGLTQNSIFYKLLEFSIRFLAMSVIIKTNYQENNKHRKRLYRDLCLLPTWLLSLCDLALVLLTFFQDDIFVDLLRCTGKYALIIL